MAEGVAPTRGGDVRVVRLQGEYDISSLDALTASLGDLTAGQALVVDMREVTFFDVASITVLGAAAAELMTTGGSLVVAAPPPNIERVLTLTGFSKMCPVVASVDDAVARAHPSPSR